MGFWHLHKLVDLFWCGERPFNIPITHVYSSVNQSVQNFVFRTPCSQSLRAPVDGDHNRVSLVPTLFARGCPSAIARLVVSVYINTVKRMCGCRASTYISQKFPKRFIKKFNAPSAIIFKESAVGVATSSSSLTVGSQFNRFASVSLFAVFIVSALLYFPQFTTARDGVSGSQRGSTQNGQTPTLTQAQPINVVVLGSAPQGNDLYAGKSLTDHVGEVMPERANRVIGVKIESRHIDLRYRLICSGSRELLTQFREPFLFYHNAA